MRRTTGEPEFTDWRTMLAGFLSGAFIDAKALIRNRRFVETSAIILGLGIGIGSSAVSITWSLTNHGPAVPEPDQLVYLYKAGGNPLRPPPEPTEHLADVAFHLRIRAKVERPFAAQLPLDVVSSNYFRIIGLRPQFGRDFGDTDDLQGAAPTIIISDRLWRNRFDGRPDILGTTIRLDNGGAFTIVGIGPASFGGLAEPWDAAQAWTTRSALFGDAGGNIHMFAFTRAEAVARSEDWLGRAFAGDSGVNSGQPMETRRAVDVVTPFEPKTSEAIRELASLVFGIIASILLIAAINLAGAFSARFLLRQRDFAVRRALGASSPRSLGTMLTEVLVVCLIGGGLGLLVGIGLTNLYRVYGVPVTSVTRYLSPQLFVTAATSTLLIGLIVSLVPAFRLLKHDRKGGLYGLVGQMGSRRSSQLLRFGVILPQLTVALALAALALLQLPYAVRSAATSGYDSEHVLVATVSPRESRTDVSGIPDQGAIGVYRIALGNLRQELPDADIQLSTMLPSAVPAAPLRIAMSRQPAVTTVTAISYVSPGYFKLLAIPFLGGTSFPDDSSKSMVVVSRRVADGLGGISVAIGSEVAFVNSAGALGPSLTVVGVVEDVRSVEDGQERPLAYRPYYQILRSGSFPMEVLVRPTGQSADYARLLQAALDSSASPVSSLTLTTLDAHREGAARSQRLSTAALTVAALAAVGVAALGVFGTVAFLVAGRRQEFAVRLLVGASRNSVAWLAVSQVLGLVAIAALPSYLIGRAVSVSLGGLQLINTAQFGIAFGVALLGLSLTAGLAALGAFRRTFTWQATSLFRDS